MKEIASETPKQSEDNKIENQVQAVFALLRGANVKAVSKRFDICRDSLYKLRRRAIDAVRRAIEHSTTKKKPLSTTG